MTLQKISFLTFPLDKKLLLVLVHLIHSSLACSEENAEVGKKNCCSLYLWTAHQSSGFQHFFKNMRYTGNAVVHQPDSLENNPPAFK